MELEGVVQNGVIVPDDAAALPEGTRVRIIVAPGKAKIVRRTVCPVQGGRARLAGRPGRATRPLSPRDAEAMTVFARAGFLKPGHGCDHLSVPCMNSRSKRRRSIAARRSLREADRFR